MHTLLLESFFPTITIFFALTLALFCRPKGLFLNAIQAFSAGIIIASIATELLPRLNVTAAPGSIFVAFILGVLLMFFLNRLNPGCCNSKVANAPLAPFVTAFCIEFGLSGLLIVLAGITSHTAGLMVAISLAICSFVCGTTVSTRFISLGFNTRKVIRNTVLMALLPPIIAFVSLRGITHLSTHWLDGLLAFGIGVLLYIATADLLIGGFKSNKTSIRSFFFIGFLVILAVKAFI